MNKKIIQAQAEKMSRKVEHFNQTEIECLIREFYTLLEEQVNPGTDTQGLDRWRLRGILHNMFDITNDMMMDGVFRAFDKDKDGFISLEEWIKGMSVFLRGSLDEKIRHCYRVYDLNGDKFISKEEMFNMLKNSLIRHPSDDDPDDAVRELAEMAMKKMDYDHDGYVTFEEFKRAVQEENLMLEALGTCLPDEMAIEKYERRVFHEQLEK